MSSMAREQIIYGNILYGDDLSLVKGYVCVRDGIIHEVCEEPTSSENIIAPCFTNCHTHIGDSVCKDPCIGPAEDFVIQRDLNSLVRPPDGLKHRILAKTSDRELVEYMKFSIRDMLATGTTGFADFREGGNRGVLALKDALKDTDIDSRIFARPDSRELSMPMQEGISLLLSQADGIGMSGAHDIDLNLLEQIADTCHKSRRPFCIHAGEKSRHDIKDALSLQPDMLVHLTQAVQSDLKNVADASIPVVVCPRSNFLTGVGMAPVAEMLKSGINVGIGTDNVMLNSVNMFSEMEFLSKVFGLEDRQVFKMCTLNGASILELEGKGPLREGYKANLMVLDGTSNNLKGIQDVLSGLVRRARPDDILSIIH
ncbi:amidohydrolase family protein [Methanohalophilus halophilus]|nr:amidohydrolase family protein [Methanohalophilus halophilus]RNI10014.1 chlorohydrolase [Methanohalophilus halophilus]